MSKPTSVPRRRDSTIDKIVEPDVLVTYLCGYSLRTCATFLLWIDIILIITFFVMTILFSSLLHLYINIERHVNETKYTISLNHNKILTIDLHEHIDAETSIEFSDVAERIFVIILSSACVHLFVTVVGLTAVYYDKLELIVPYLVFLITSVLWISSFIFLELVFIGLQYVKLVWTILFIATLYALAELYKLGVIYSYYHHYSDFVREQIKTPSNLTTESPVPLPAVPHSDHIFKKNVKSEKSSRDKNQQS